MTLEEIIDDEDFSHMRHQELYEQLEKVKCPHLLSTIKYVLKIIGDMRSDRFKFTVRAYNFNIEQLLSQQYLESPELERFYRSCLIADFTNKFAYDIFLVDNKVISKIRSKIEKIKGILDHRLEEESPDVMLTDNEQRAIESACDRIENQCWLFFRGAKLYESMKILLRALEEYEDFERDPEEFKKKYGKMHLPIEVHE